MQLASARSGAVSSRSSHWPVSHPVIWAIRVAIYGCSTLALPYQHQATGTSTSHKVMRDEPPAYEETTGSSSTAIPGDNKTQLQDEDTRSKYGLISFSGYDRVRLMRFPESIVALVSETLQRHWPKGIQKVKAYYESTEFKLRGNPFEHGDDDEKVALRNAILGLLDALAREGWGVHPAAGGLGRIGNYKSLGQKDSLIFKRQAPQQLSWMCISFDSDDLMHLINAPPDVWRVRGLRCVRVWISTMATGGEVYKSSGETWFCCR
ncbi:hypothetical protein AFLA_010802 [Aspergillus flavus NRRL3357]|nr:hypothetical protein AFLA_010802 [Aspergillus flavus NRRL3357]